MEQYSSPPDLDLLSGNFRSLDANFCSKDELFIVDVQYIMEKTCVTVLISTNQKLECGMPDFRDILMKMFSGQVEVRSFKSVGFVFSLKK